MPLMLIMIVVVTVVFVVIVIVDVINVTGMHHADFLANLSFWCPCCLSMRYNVVDIVSLWLYMCSCVRMRVWVPVCVCVCKGLSPLME